MTFEQMYSEVMIDDRYKSIVNIFLRSEDHIEKIKCTFGTCEGLYYHRIKSTIDECTTAFNTIKNKNHEIKKHIKHKPTIIDGSLFSAINS